MAVKTKNVYRDVGSHVELDIYGKNGDVRGVALISKEYEAIVKEHHWHVVQSKKRLYAHAHIGDNKYVKMHRLIAKEMYGESEKSVDHKNRSGLDNRSDNLRYATNSEQGHNKDLFVNNTSGVKGVGFNKQYGKWRAEIRHKKKHVARHFDSFDDAVQQRKVWERMIREGVQI